MFKFNECWKPHLLLHLVSGIGLGFLILALAPQLVNNALMYGLVLIILSILGEFVVKK